MSALNRICRAAKAFARDRRGVAAVEFAMIAPVMILGYVGTSELSTAMMTSRRISHSTSAIGDLLSQQQTTTKASVTDMLAAGAIIMQPFSTTPMGLRLTSITLQSSGTNSGKTTVDWSDANGSGLTALTKGTVISNATVTKLVTTANPSIVMADGVYAFTSPVPYFLPHGVAFSETFYLSPRYGSTITCADC